MTIKLKSLPFELSVCKLADLKDADKAKKFFFLSRTQDEISLVCPSADAPGSALEREDGWRAFYVEGTLDFSLVGILSRLSAILAGANIGIFAVSTYDTDYILVKKENYEKAKRALAEGDLTVE